MLPIDIWFQILLHCDVYFVTTTATLLNSSFAFLRAEPFWNIKWSYHLKSKSTILSLLLQNQSTADKLFTKKQLCQLVEFEYLYTIAEERIEREHFYIGRCNVVGSQPKNRDSFAVQMAKPEVDFGSPFTMDFAMSHCYSSIYEKLPYVKIQAFHFDGTGGRDFRTTLRDYAFRNLDLAIILFETFDMDNYFCKEDIVNSTGSIGKAMQIFTLAKKHQVKYLALVGCVDTSAKFTVDLKEVRDFCDTEQVFFVQVNQSVIKPGAYYDIGYDKAALKQLNLFTHSIVASVKKPRHKPLTISTATKRKRWCSVM